MRKLMSISAAMMIGMVTLLWVSPASTEPGNIVSPTWGVEGLGATNMTGTIRSQVWTIEQIGDRIYVGGKFTDVTDGNSNYSQPYLAAFDVNTGDWISSFSPVVNGPVYALEASPDGSRLYVGGEFTDVNGVANTEALVALNPVTGAVDTSWVVGIDNRFTTIREAAVMSMHVVDGWVYVGGYFNSVNNHTTRVNVSRLTRISQASGVADSSWTPWVAAGSVWGVRKHSNGRIYAVGTFASVNGDTDAEYMAVISGSTGALEAGVTSYVSQTAYPNRGYLQDVEVYDDSVWVGGSEHAIYKMDAVTNVVERIHSTRQGGDFQDLEIVGDRIYASCHCYINHYEDYDIWVNRNIPVPATVSVTSIKYVTAYDASSGDHIDSFYLNASATRAGIWAIHGDTNGCLWFGGDMSRGTNPNGSNRALHGFGKWCDPGVTAPPDGLVSTYQNTNRIVLHWTDDTAATYNIYRDGVLIDTDTNGWYTDTGLTAGTTYNYVVTAVIGGVESASTSTVSATTTGGSGVSAPVNLVSTYQNTNRIVLHWTDDPTVDYIIYRDGTQVATDSDGWYTDTGLTAGTTYNYIVTATKNGAESPSTATALVTTSGGSGNTITLTTTSHGRTWLVLNWNDVGGLTDSIWRDGSQIAVDSDGWYTDTGLTPGTTHTYTVQHDLNGTVVVSNTVTVTLEP